MTVAPTADPWLPPHVIRALEADSDCVGSWWPTAVWTGLTLMLLCWWWWRGRRRDGRRRRERRWPIIVAAVLCVASAAVAGVNAYAGYVPSVEAARLLLDGPGGGGGLHHGRVSVVRIAVPRSLHLNVSDTYVYTPPGYGRDQSRRYPVAYLIHGTPGQSADWASAGQIGSTMDILIRAKLVPPMIVVAPDMNAPASIDTECLDAADPGGPQLAGYLNSVVVSYIDGHYRTLADWRHRVIGGFSMGGYCALDQGLRTGLYAAIIDLAGDTNPGAGGHAMLPSTADYLAATPSHYVPTMTFDHPVAIFLDEGGEDAFGGDQLDRVAAQLRDRGQLVVQRSEPGEYHSWTMARLGVAYGLRFASGRLG